MKGRQLLYRLLPWLWPPLLWWSLLSSCERPVYQGVYYPDVPFETENNRDGTQTAVQSLGLLRKPPEGFVTRTRIPDIALLASLRTPKRVIYLRDTLHVRDTVLTPGAATQPLIEVAWQHTSPHRLLRGVSRLTSTPQGKWISLGTTIEDSVRPINFQIGLRRLPKKRRGGDWEVTLTPEDTSFKVGTLKGAILDPSLLETRPALAVRPTVNVGIGLTPVGLQPYVGVGLRLETRIPRWLRRKRGPE